MLDELRNGPDGSLHSLPKVARRSNFVLMTCASVQDTRAAHAVGGPLRSSSSTAPDNALSGTCVGPLAMTAIPVGCHACLYFFHACLPLAASMISQSLESGTTCRDIAVSDQRAQKRAGVVRRNGDLRVSGMDPNPKRQQI